MWGLSELVFRINRIFILTLASLASFTLCLTQIPETVNLTTDVSKLALLKAGTYLSLFGFLNGSWYMIAYLNLLRDRSPLSRDNPGSLEDIDPDFMRKWIYFNLLIYFFLVSLEIPTWIDYLGYK